MKCLICNKEHRFPKSHMRHWHDISVREYVLKFNLNVFHLNNNITLNKYNPALKCWICDQNFEVKYVVKNEHHEIVKVCKCKPKNVVVSKFISIYGNKYEILLNEQYKSMDHFSKKKCKRIYGENSDEKWLEYSNKISGSKQRYVNSYGEVEGIKKYNEFKLKCSITEIDYIKKYGEVEGKLKWVDRCDRAKITRNNMIKMYGYLGGINKWNIYLIKQRIAQSKMSVIKKHGIDCWNKRSKSKAITIDNFVKKYGEVEGKIKYNNTIIKRKISLSKEVLIKKHGIIWYNKMIDKKLSKSNYSPISQELFDSRMCKTTIVANVYYATKNKEYIRHNSELKKAYAYDFTVTGNINKIIEFNGDTWHANPSLYHDMDTPNPFNKLLTANNIWESDRIKNDFAKLIGFDLLVIWESDYKQNKNKIVEQCINFINGDK